MKVIFDSNIKARLSLDEANRVRAINHFQKYWESDKKTPLLAATDYLHQMADVLKIPKAQLNNLHQKVSFL